MFFFDEILENREVKNILLKDEALLAEGKKIADEIIATGDGSKLPDGLLCVAIFAYLADYTLEKNTKMGIPREITVASLKDVNPWVENHYKRYGEYGFSEAFWVIGFYLSQRFRLGRLQFNFAKPLPFMPQCDIVLETHIPQGEPLSYGECVKSFEMAKEFFPKFFPEKNPRYFMCDSWLLCPELVNIAEENSNIVKFMRMWTQFPFPADNSNQAIERVFGFGFKRENLINAPEKTKLQRNLKNYLLKGGNINMSAGYIEF
ncbi:MAG: hypothetical protein E7564_01060 [Ruminococcaceae bacterium]|nr:hypothetical protein [Oscillospiraceae bacterium]